MGINLDLLLVQPHCGPSLLSLPAPSGVQSQVAEVTRWLSLDNWLELKLANVSLADMESLPLALLKGGMKIR
jgi:hypothetical protein